MQNGERQTSPWDRNDKDPKRTRDDDGYSYKRGQWFLQHHLNLLYFSFFFLACVILNYKPHTYSCKTGLHTINY